VTSIGKNVFYDCLNLALTVRYDTAGEQYALDNEILLLYGW